MTYSDPSERGSFPLARGVLSVDIIPILVACALDCDLQNSLNMGFMFFGKRASAAQIGIKRANCEIWAELKFLWHNRCKKIGRANFANDLPHLHGCLLFEQTV